MSLGKPFGLCTEAAVSPDTMSGIAWQLSSLLDTVLKPYKVWLYHFNFLCLRSFLTGPFTSHLTSGGGSYSASEVPPTGGSKFGGADSCPCCRCSIYTAETIFGAGYIKLCEPLNFQLVCVALHHAVSVIK